MFSLVCKGVLCFSLYLYFSEIIIKKQTCFFTMKMSKQSSKQGFRGQWGMGVCGYRDSDSPKHETGCPLDGKGKNLSGKGEYKCSSQFIG